MCWSYYDNYEKTAQPIIDRLSGECKWNHCEAFVHHLSTISRHIGSFNCNVFLYPINQYYTIVFEHIYKKKKQKLYITKNERTLLGNHVSIIYKINLSPVVTFNYRFTEKKII